MRYLVLFLDTNLVRIIYVNGFSSACLHGIYPIFLNSCVLMKRHEVPNFMPTARFLPVCCVHMRLLPRTIFTHVFILYFNAALFFSNLIKFDYEYCSFFLNIYISSSTKAGLQYFLKLDNKL